jgi:hypothetical protein
MQVVVEGAKLVVVGAKPVAVAANLVVPATSVNGKVCRSASPLKQSIRLAREEQNLRGGKRIQVC